MRPTLNVCVSAHSDAQLATPWALQLQVLLIQSSIDTQRPLKCAAVGPRSCDPTFLILISIDRPQKAHLRVPEKLHEPRLCSHLKQQLLSIPSVHGSSESLQLALTVLPTALAQPVPGLLLGSCAPALNVYFSENGLLICWKSLHVAIILCLASWPVEIPSPGQEI